MRGNSFRGAVGESDGLTAGSSVLGCRAFGEGVATFGALTGEPVGLGLWQCGRDHASRSVAGIPRGQPFSADRQRRATTADRQRVRLALGVALRLVEHFVTPTAGRVGQAWRRQCRREQIEHNPTLSAPFQISPLTCMFPDEGAEGAGSIPFPLCARPGVGGLHPLHPARPAAQDHSGSSAVFRRTPANPRVPVRIVGRMPLICSSRL
jgi:hypothetical protein